MIYLLKPVLVPLFLDLKVHTFKHLSDRAGKTAFPALWLCATLYYLNAWKRQRHRRQYTGRNLHAIRRSFFLFLWGRQGKRFFPLPVHQILRFPEKKECPIAGYCRLRIPTPSNTEFRSRGQRGCSSSLLGEESRILVSLRVSIGQEKMSLSSLLGIERKEQCHF